MRAAAVCVFALCVATGSAQAAVINPGFETGDFTGWTNLAGANASVVTSNTTNYSPGDWGTDHTFLPYAGNYFLAVRSADAYSWQEVYQAVALGAGDTIGGYARFDWGDYISDLNNPDFFRDGAKVEIRDSLGNVVATPFYYDGALVCGGLCSPGTGNAGYETAWTAWSFTAVNPDTYTIVYAARNTGDSGGPNQTFGYFDAKIPEPATLVLFGLAGAALYRRRRA